MTAAEVTAVLEKQERLSKAVLSAHGSRFKEQWKEWCCECRVQARFAHPSYPQDKGKVERCIQNLNREGFLLTVPTSYSSLSLSPEARAKTC